MADVTENVVTTEDEDVEIDEGQSEYKTIGEQLHLFGMIFGNTNASPEIKTALASFNYTDEKITEGKNLLEDVHVADAQNKKEYGEQYAATEKVEKEFKEASGPYMETLGVARIALKKDPQAAKALVLKGKRQKKLAEWVRDADIFYRNLLNTPEYLAKMAKFNRTSALLEAQYKEIADVSAALSAQKKESAEAVASTAVRDTKLAALADWMSDFIGIAKVALKSKPEELKKLGL